MVSFQSRNSFLLLGISFSLLVQIFTLLVIFSPFLGFIVPMPALFPSFPSFWQIMLSGIPLYLHTLTLIHFKKMKLYTYTVTSLIWNEMIDGNQHILRKCEWVIVDSHIAVNAGDCNVCNSIPGLIFISLECLIRGILFEQNPTNIYGILKMSLF